MIPQPKLSQPRITKTDSLPATSIRSPSNQKHKTNSFNIQHKKIELTTIKIAENLTIKIKHIPKINCGIFRNFFLFLFSYWIAIIILPKNLQNPYLLFNIQEKTYHSTKNLINYSLFKPPGIPNFFANCRVNNSNRNTPHVKYYAFNQLNFITRLITV